MEYNTADNDAMQDLDLLKIHFVLKLWVVTNTKLVDYLRWNQDHTLLIVNVPAMAEQWQANKNAIFLINRTEDFLFLLKINGFEQCSLDVLAKSEQDTMEEGCLIYRHHQFLSTNYEYFNKWLFSPDERDNDFEQKYCCTIPQEFDWPVGKNLEEFSEIRKKIMFEMMLLQSRLRYAVCQQENQTIDIPAEYVDQEVKQAPQYGENIAGNYGEVTSEELKNFFGSKLPQYVDAVVQDNSIEDPIQEEGGKNDYSMIENAPYVLAQENLDASNRYRDMRELYECLDLWEDNDGALIECQEVLEIPKEPEPVQQQVKLERECGDFVPPSNEGTLQMSGNMSQYLTNSMKYLLPPIDSD